MFCNRCGAQVEPTDNFCKNCGMGLNRSGASPVSENSMAEPRRIVSPETIRQGSGKAAQPFSPPRERRGFGAMFITLGLAVVVIAGSALYFGIDLLLEPTKKNDTLVAEKSSGRVEAPDPLSTDEAKQRANSEENLLPSAPKPEASTSARAAPGPDTVSKAVAKSEGGPPPRNAALESRKPASGTGTASVSSRPPGRAFSGGTYETTRSTPVFESPSDSANVVANIPGGVRVNVVSAKGDWLEVHSKRGNPPGYIRRQDATFLGKAN